MTVLLLVALCICILLLLLIIALSILLLLLVIALSILLLLLVIALSVLLLLLIVTLGVLLLLLLLIVAWLWLLIVHEGGRQHLLDHHRLDLVVQHVGDQLLGYLLQHLLSQVTLLDGFIIPDELYDVTSAGLAHAVLETGTVTVKLLHHGKIGVTHANDDDGDWVHGELEDKILGLLHVMDCSVC